MPDRQRLQNLSIFLLREGLDADGQVLRVGEGLEMVDVDLGAEIQARLHIRQTPDNPPRWVRFFEGSVDLPVLASASASAVLLVRTQQATFALAFGYGRHLLRTDAYVEGFGLRVTLNSIEPEKIRSIDASCLDSPGLQLRQQVARHGPIDYFGMNIEKDLLRAVTGNSSLENDPLGPRWTPKCGHRWTAEKRP